ADHHAQILFDSRDFILEEIDKDADIAINGKKKRRARLVHGDRVTLGAVEIGFSMFAEVAAPVSSDGDDEPANRAPKVSSELAGVRKLFAFSEKLMGRKNEGELLEAMLDDVIELTHADKGFLILLEGAEAAAGEAPPSGPEKSSEKKLVVRASRNVR